MTSPPLGFDDLRAHIEKLTDERELTILESVISLRRHALEQEAQNTLGVGSQVAFGTRVSPRYLTGMRGTIRAINANGRLTVELDPPSVAALRAMGRRFGPRPGQESYAIDALRSNLRPL
ncbi:hypothetical protein [Embleya sp. NPDC059237]|uniref:hypothetical protein n=1 Tax=Embleya sp. NPDC059237 TaxID=3346784 RepID=UPI0036BFAE20